MSVRTASRRRQRRYTIGLDKSATVEFEYPSPNGRPYRMKLVNISVSGLSFALDDHDDLALLDAGTTIPDGTVQIGDCTLRGDLMLMHLTPDELSRGMCGALFYPSSDTDLVKLRCVIAGMEAVGSD
jgi:hypothetical protein